MQAEIVNRVAASGLLTLNLEDYRPTAPVVGLDIKDQLFMGLMLREKDFREYVKATDWAAYAGQNVAIYCSTDAIVPAWAYVLLTTALSAHAAFVYHGTPDDLTLHLHLHNLRTGLNASDFADQKVVLKGCGTVPTAVYVEAARLLTPVVQKLMYGEPCSTVPIYKR